MNSNTMSLPTSPHTPQSCKNIFQNKPLFFEGRSISYNYNCDNSYNDNYFLSPQAKGSVEFNFEHQNFGFMPIQMNNNEIAIKMFQSFRENRESKQMFTEKSKFNSPAPFYYKKENNNYKNKSSNIYYLDRNSNGNNLNMQCQGVNQSSSSLEFNDSKKSNFII
jgi:hypothetical protein